MEKTLIFALLFCIGCVTPGMRTQAVNNTLSNWEGRHINDLVKAIGYPTREFQAPNGNTVYAFEKAQVGTTPVYVAPTQTNTTHYGRTSQANTYGGNVYGGRTVTYYCNLYFETNAEKKIVFWRWEGNNCN